MVYVRIADVCRMDRRIALLYHTYPLEQHVGSAVLRSSRVCMADDARRESQMGMASRSDRMFNRNSCF